MDKKIKVIIADDIERIAEMNKGIAVNNENIEVIGLAYNGKDELDMILKLKPDLVITDNKMPEMNGIDVIEQINNMHIENKPEFILVTGDYGMELAIKCRELGVFAIVNKLSSEDDLANAIKEFVEYGINIHQENISTTKKEEEINNSKNGILNKILEKMKKRGIKNE